MGPAYTLASWQREYFDQDASLPGTQDKQLMFLQPDRPLHLLTELMWRFQGKDQWGKGHALAIFPSNNSALFKIVKKTTSIPLILVDSHDGDLYDYLNDLHNNGWEKEKKRLCKELNRIRNNWKGDASVPLGRGYKIDDIERLMRRPLDILSGNKEPYKSNPPSNIFYLPDVVETEHIGAIDFEINTPIDPKSTA